MNGIRIAAATLLTTALAATAARADIFTHLCTSGALRTCGSIQIGTQPFPGNVPGFPPRTLVTFRTNLPLSLIGVEVPNVVTTGSGMPCLGQVSDVRDQGWNWEQNHRGGNCSTPVRVGFGIALSHDPAGGPPCNTVSQPLACAFWWDTVDFNTATGFWTVAFWTHTAWSVADVSEFSVLFDPAHGSVSCGFDSAGNALPGGSCEVTPEPVTLTLMATGLLFTGGMRLRRRRASAADG